MQNEEINKEVQNEMLYEDQIKRFSKKRNRYKNKDNILKKFYIFFSFKNGNHK